MTLAVLIDFLTINLEENSEQLRHKLTAAETEKKRMAAEMGKLNTENEANLGRLEELKKRIVADAQAHAQERGKLQKRFDADYAVFLGRKGEFNESLRLRCVFCPQENQVPLTSFLFHVAREHMFDQARGMTNCSSLKLFLCILTSVSDPDPHLKRPPGSGSAWIDADLNPDCS